MEKKENVKKTKIDTIEYMHILFMCLTESDPTEYMNQLFDKVIKNMLVEMPEIERIFALHHAVMNKDVQEILRLLPEFVEIVIKVTDIDAEDAKVIIQKAKDIANIVSYWLKVIVLILKKEKLDKQKFQTLKSEIKQALKVTLAY